MTWGQREACQSAWLGTTSHIRGLRRIYIWTTTDRKVSRRDAVTKWGIVNRNRIVVAAFIVAIVTAADACSSSASTTAYYTDNPLVVMRAMGAKGTSLRDSSTEAEGTLPSGDTLDCGTLISGYQPYSANGYFPGVADASQSGTIFSSDGDMACAITDPDLNTVDGTENVQVATVIHGSVDGTNY